LGSFLINATFFSATFSDFRKKRRFPKKNREAVRTSYTEGSPLPNFKTQKAFDRTIFAFISQKLRQKTMDNSPFSQVELARYARHFALPDFGMEGQIKLKNSRVLVVGAGGLGCPVLLYLAAAGVGHIGIIDGDKVDDSNLQRQVLYTVADVGKWKAEAAKERLLAMNPHIDIQSFTQHLTSENALELISKYDVIADGTDNFPTRYLVNDACVLAGKVNVYASIFRFEGQISVFNLTNNDGERGVNYRDIFPSPPPAGLIPDCAEGGVLGVLPGIIGSMQASEVIKVLTNIGEPLAGRLFLFDAQTFTAKSLKIKKNPQYQPIEKLIDYEIFCGVKTIATIPEISIADFKQMQAQNIDFQLIDVREPYEYAVANLGGVLYPLSILPEKATILSKKIPIIIHCQSGARSAKAVAELQKLGFDNAVSLSGGIKAYLSA
jgi:sulfur-carrier protein adenylyltransferase/sulfurtransferase